MYQSPGRSWWFLPLYTGATILVLMRPCLAQSGSSLDRLLESPWNARPLDDPWLPRFTSSIGAFAHPDHPWQNGDTGLRTRTLFAYPTYYRFGQRLPDTYNDQDLRFWSNSYGGPWYYPGSPANTRSSWLEWPDADW
jgi:hypothetical protein